MGSERVQNKPEEDDSFMVTYVSLMILLLTFMILLVTLAQVKEPRFRKAIGSFRGALSFLPYAGGDDLVQDGSRGFLPTEILKPGEGEEVSNAAIEAIEKASGSKQFEGLEITQVEGGIRIRIADQLMFERGKADLKPDIFPILDLVATAVVAKPSDVIVVGHTCDLPISTRQFPSNWDLSLARAINVVHYLQEKSVPPERLFPYGLADEMPIVKNDSEKSRSRNRRVEIYLVNRSEERDIDHE
ncbi:MAG: OmpA/MotB family protein [bacterium]